ncbi:hypothetical protein MLD38_032399 [Melastoma candidum]|uniref:Uncharacterized protein n=1 Tax=Melastoma candidum TaxID=119954 RepID=A0ACB9M3X6_9MYRT|nr:hypothetical protein MLD38_032399 [Melastoma candidum]
MADASQALSFSFTSFDDSGGPLLIDTQGSSKVVSPVLKLTPSVPGNTSSYTGRVTYNQPLHLWDHSTGKGADFTVRFTFSIDSKGNTSFGDGLAFFFAPEGSNWIPTSSQGGFLGLISDPNQNSRNSTSFVAVEIDSYRDEWDPECKHIGIDVDDISSTKYTCVPWLRERILVGGRVDTTITYSSSDQMLGINLTDVDDPSNSSSLYYNVNLKQYLPETVAFGFSATTGSSFESHTIHSWEMNSTVIGGGKKGWKWQFVVGLCLGIAVVLGLVVVAIVHLGRHWSSHRNCGKVNGLPTSDKNLEIRVIGPPCRTASRAPELDRLGSQVGPKEYTYEALQEATNGFSEEKKLGKGGFGEVYKGNFGGLEDVAIKKIKRNSEEDQIHDYTRELKIISGLSHRNLVKLLGWCHEKADEYLFLVYEFMPKLSLDCHLFNNNGPVLPWNKRYNIAKGLASALAYLHGDKVIHRYGCKIRTLNDFCLQERDGTRRNANYNSTRKSDLQGH